MAEQPTLRPWRVVMPFHTPLSYYDPPFVELVDEECDGLQGDTEKHVLDEHVYRFPPVITIINGTRDQFLCSGCMREVLLRYYRDATPSCLDEYPFDVQAAERCDQCHLYRCRCPEER